VGRWGGGGSGRVGRGGGSGRLRFPGSDSRTMEAGPRPDKALVGKVLLGKALVGKSLLYFFWYGGGAGRVGWVGARGSGRPRFSGSE
jgi:hypothetical protein